MKPSRLIRKIHQTVGVLIGLQVLLWVSGGVVMSAIPLARVRGEDRAAPNAEALLATDRVLLTPLEAARAAGMDSLTGAELTPWLGRAVYRLQAAGRSALVDAAEGTVLSPISAVQAKSLALADYTGDAATADPQWLTEPRGEIRGQPLPLWRVAFDDARRTTLYISPQSGRVVARRNRFWRIYDVFWMFHIMDYRAREDFNHPLLIGSAATAWVLTTSGLWLAASWLLRRRRSRPN